MNKTNKIKIAKKTGLTKIVIKSIKGQQLIEHEVYSINNNEVPGLLHLDVVTKKDSFKLEYDITGFITFREYLKTPLNKESFARILQCILDNLNSLKRVYFHKENLLMDFNEVMVNPSTQRIYFVYVPIQGFESGNILRDFLLEIIQCCSFVSDEDSSYIKDYITILNSGFNFSEFELEEYIKGLFGQNVVDDENVECPNCHTKLPKGTNYCYACGSKISGNTGNFSGKGVYDPFSDGPAKTPPTSQTDERVEPPKEQVYTPPVEPVEQEQVQDDEVSGTQGLSDGTTVLGATGSNGTTVLGYDVYQEPSYPFLVRDSNNEKAVINQPSFRVGKEQRFCNYYVSDNSAVSRKHADIITRDGRYFIMDLNSTNRTYVDGRAIPTQTEVEIFDGTRVRLANEDFTFYIEEK